MARNEINSKDRLYAKHGKKYPQGALVMINGHRALANYKGDSIVSYTTLEELQEEFFRRDLPEINGVDLGMSL